MHHARRANCARARRETDDCGRRSCQPYAARERTMKLPRLVIISILLGGASPAFPQTPVQPRYTINPRYTPGQTISLLLESRIEDARDNLPEQVYRAPVALRVLRQSTSGTILEWRAGKGTLENGRAGDDPMLQMAERIVTELALVVQLDASGLYLGVQNEADLRSRVEVFTRLLIPQTTAKIADATARDRAAAAMSAALTPEAM